MADLASGNAGSDYPTALDSWTDKVNDSDQVNAAEWNNLTDAIIKVQKAIGTNVKGSLADLKTYLQTEHNADGTHKTTLSSPTIVNPTWATGLTLNGNGWPSFQAIKSTTQTNLAANTGHDVEWDSTTLDTGSYFNATGSVVNGIPAYSFKPPVGTYLFTGSVVMSTLATGKGVLIILTRNDVSVQSVLQYNYQSISANTFGSFTFIGRSDGTTYFKIAVQHDNSVASSVSFGGVNNSFTQWTGSKIA